MGFSRLRHFVIHTKLNSFLFLVIYNLVSPQQVQQTLYFVLSLILYMLVSSHTYVL